MKISHFLRKTILRFLSGQGEGNDTGSIETESIRLFSRMQDEIDRYRVSARRRESVHRKLRSRYRKQKDFVRTINAERKALVRKIEIYEGHGAGPAAHSWLAPGVWVHNLPEDDRGEMMERILRLQKRMWKYPMRLGVLRHHPPRPLALEFTRMESPAPVATGSGLPSLSVVTPSYQQAAFLERTLLSVLGQCGPGCEYLVMDGGSTDGSVEIIRKHEARLACWRSEPDGGPAEAINKGFARSTGEIMAWLNSDDLWFPGTVRRVLEYFARHPEVDVVYGHRILIDAADHRVGHWTLPPHDGEMMLWADYIPQETMFWRRSIWEKSGGALDESFKFAFDWDLLLRFQRAGGRFHRMPRFLGGFRIHADQKSHAEIQSVGTREMERIRRRELGDAFDPLLLGLKNLEFQRRAIRYDRLLRLGIRR